MIVKSRTRTATDASRSMAGRESKSDSKLCTYAGVRQAPLLLEKHLTSPVCQEMLVPRDKTPPWSSDIGVPPWQIRLRSDRSRTSHRNLAPELRLSPQSHHKAALLPWQSWLTGSGSGVLSPVKAFFWGAPF